MQAEFVGQIPSEPSVGMRMVIAPPLHGVTVPSGKDTTLDRL